MSVIGIDPGTAITGYGIIEEDDLGRPCLITYGVIRTEPTEKNDMRLNIIFTELKQILNLHRPNSAAVEKLFFQKNVTNAIAVGQARGVILLALAQAGIPNSEYTPTEVKNNVTGYGAADKMQVQRMVQTILRLDSLPKPDDAADALAIAICHLHATGYTRLKDQDG